MRRIPNTKGVVKMEKKNNDSSDRRRFIRKLAKLGAAGGIAALLFGSDRIAPVQAAIATPMVVDWVNTGTKTTHLNSSVRGVSGKTTWAFGALATTGSGDVTGIYGRSESTNGTGVWGMANAATGSTVGVHGVSASTSGIGVKGYVSASRGPTVGVYGHSESIQGIGAYGIATGKSGLNRGVWGSSDSTEGRGVEGYVSATTGNTIGVRGASDSTGGIAVAGYANAAAGVTRGVYGRSDSTSGNGVEGFAGAATGTNRGVFGQSNSSGGRGVEGYAGAAKAIPIVARGYSGQTANLQEWQNNAGTPLSVVDKDGRFGVGTGSPSFKIHVVGIVNPTALSLDSYGNAESNIMGRRARGTVASPSAAQADDALLILNGTGYGATRFSSSYRSAIRLCAAENWTDTAQGTYIRFDTTQNRTAGNRETMRINHNGFVGIGTTAPTERLHVVGKVRATEGFITGDIEFANGVKATEEGEGLAFMNNAGEKIAVLDREGNIHIKGKVVQDL